MTTVEIIGSDNISHNLQFIHKDFLDHDGYVVFQNNIVKLKLTSKKFIHPESGEQYKVNFAEN